MKTNQNRILKTLLSSIVFICMYSGCSHEDQLLRPDDNGMDKEVLFSINIPGTSATGTRALGNGEEHEISSIEMLLFHPSTKMMVHHPVFANVITPDPNHTGEIAKKSFTVHIPEGTYDVMIFANARKAFNSVTLTSGEGQEETLAKLKVVMPSGGWATNPSDPAKSYLIPMWGLKKGVTVGQGTTISNVYMHRMISRIDVRVTGADTQTGNFKLKKINLYNIQKEGRIAPVMTNWNENGMVNGTIAAGLATAPSLVSGCGDYTSIGYDLAIASDQKSCEGGIYLFETPKATASTYLAAPYLTVKGEFEGIEGWYRIDLADYSTMDYYDVLRNHLYKVNIAKVTGTGYPDEEDAKKNRTDNIVVNVTPWNEYELDETKFEGQYFLSVSPQDAAYDSNAHTGQTLTIKMNSQTPLTLAHIKLSGSDSNPNTALAGGWISNLSLSPKSVVNNVNVYTLTYDVGQNNGAVRMGYIYVMIDRMTIVARIAQIAPGVDVMTITPDHVVLSPVIGHRTKTVRITTNGPWTLIDQPANATVLPTHGFGAADLTIDYSTTTPGSSTFTIRNTMTSQAVTVAVDNCFLYGDELLLTNVQGNNTGVYTIAVDGGSEAFTIAGYSPWITSATILPNGDLEITAPQYPGGNVRTGTITLAHADDQDYQITCQIIQDKNINELTPFDYLTVGFTNDLSLDVDIAVEFAGNEWPALPGTFLPFDNNLYYTGTTSSNNTRRSVGLGQAFYIYADGSRVGNFSGQVPLATGTASGVPLYKIDMLQNGLLFWGGDGKKNEMVFFNAPHVTPPSRREDLTGLPRYLNLEVYAAWYPDAGVSGINPITVTVNTYTGGMMLKPSSNVGSFFSTNFYNVAAGTASITGATQVLDPECVSSYTFQCDTYYSQREKFRSDYRYMCTIKYDRYRREAKVIWHE